MDKRVRLSMLLVAAIALVAVSAVVVLAAPTQGSSSQYGPCCPLVKGQTAPKIEAAQGWGRMSVKGPRFTCHTPEPVDVSYGGATRKVNALEAQGALFVPARLFAFAGATIQWEGGRGSTMTLGDRKVAILGGNHTVHVSDVTGTHTITWGFCPRTVQGVTYVPIREAAEALGLTTEWKNGAVDLALATTKAAPAVAEKPAACPADRVEGVLGIKVLRGPADSKYGQGVAVTEVTKGREAAEMGLKPMDIIISADGHAVQCPQDLDAAVTRARKAGGYLDRMTVVRAGHRLSLDASS